MGWFRRKRRIEAADGSESATAEAPDPRTPWPEQPVPGDPHAAAADFWRAWAELLPHLSAALGEGDSERAENLLVEPVAAVHPGLQFSVDRGQRAIYALVVSGREDPELRPYTDAWKVAAPPDDAIWEYHDSVPPVPDPAGVAVNFAGKRFELGEVRIVAQVDDSDGVVDVAVHHPLFGEVDEAVRRTMTFLPLDVTLGERLAAERLGRVETAVAPPSNTLSLVEFRTLVRGLAGLPADEAPDGDGEGGDRSAGQGGGQSEGRSAGQREGSRADRSDDHSGNRSDTGDTGDNGNDTGDNGGGAAGDGDDVAGGRHDGSDDGSDDGTDKGAGGGHGGDQRP